MVKNNVTTRRVDGEWPIGGIQQVSGCGLIRTWGIARSDTSQGQNGSEPTFVQGSVRLQHFKIMSELAEVGVKVEGESQALFSRDAR